MSSRFRQALAEVAATGRAAGPMEFEFRRPDGQLGVLHSTIFEIPLGSAERCFVCMDVDRTERKRMEAAVRSGERLRELIYESVLDVIFCLAVEDEKLLFVSVNPAFLRATGRLEREVLGQDVREVLSGSSLDAVLAKASEAIASAGPVSWEDTFQTPSGIRHGEVTMAPIFDSAGRCTNLVGTVRDISHHKRAEEERRRPEATLNQAQRMQSLGTLVGGIAHDFNNVLTAIAGNAEIGLLEVGEDHAAHESLTEIRRATRRATDLVRQILSFSRQEAPVRRAVRVPEVIREALALLRATLPASVELVTELDGSTPAISADPSQVHQVLMNLAANAVHAMVGRHGVLCVSCNGVVVDSPRSAPRPELLEGKYAVISVSDTGVGMDAATRARAFEPFFTTRAKGQGTGLGLSVVHGIMQSHEGGVTIQSELGQGTTFNLDFPASLAHPEQSERPRAAAPMAVGKHILYVDDEEALVFLATRMLPRSGYRVTGHSDSLQALLDFRARADEFDAVVTDITMPGLSGPELVRELRQVQPDVPIVMTSGYIRPEDVECAKSLGVGELILKPDTVDELTRVLHHKFADMRAGGGRSTAVPD